VLTTKDFEQFENLALTVAQVSQREFEPFVGIELHGCALENIASSARDALLRFLANHGLLVPGHFKLDQSFNYRVNKSCDCTPTTLLSGRKDRNHVWPSASVCIYTSLPTKASKKHLSGQAIRDSRGLLNHNSFNQKTIIDTTPLPDSIPPVAELGASSAPLLSASFFIGARCRAYNDDFMQCKTDSGGKGEVDCLKEGRRVTRCAASV
jgi:hypothetical protein